MRLVTAVAFGVMLSFATGFVVGQIPGLSVTAEIIKADMQLHVCKNRDRLESVKTLFKKKGAADDEIRIEQLDDVENLVITKKGNSEETIVIGAHYDKIGDGCGAIDNWTGLVIVANLFAAFRAVPTDKTLVFVAFGKEEQGLIGSGEMARSIPKEKRGQFCSMINFDSFGLHDPQVLSNRSNSKMTKFATELASELKMPLSKVSLEADADSSSFLAKGIPAITFVGLSNNWKEYLHSSKDKLDKVNHQSVLVGYNFGALYLSKIEAKPCNAFRKEGALEKSPRN